VHVEKPNIGDLVMLLGENFSDEIGIVLDIGERVEADEYIVIEQILVRWSKSHKSSWVSLSQIKVISGIQQ